MINFGLNKRQKIIVASFLLTIGLLSTQMVDFNLRFRFIAGLGVLAYLLSLWALWEGISILKALVLLILPTFFTLAVASFYFLLPIRWLTRLPVGIVFGLSFYLLLLSQNVFNVASIRTIPLYRASTTASFLFTLITAFFLFNVIHAFNMFFTWNGLLVGLISFPLILQTIWQVDMEERIKMESLVISLILSLSLGEVALAFSFWPMATTMWSLTLSTFMYVILGIVTHSLRGRLSRRVVWEYLGIGGGVLIVALLTTSWTG
jgi:hypothetical protein